jgi:hypothetical protein
VTYAEQFPELLLELLDARPSVCKPAAIYDVTDPPQEVFFVTDVGTTNVKRLVEGRLAAEYGEIVDRLLCRHTSVS